MNTPPNHDAPNPAQLDFDNLPKDFNWGVHPSQVPDAHHRDPTWSPHRPAQIQPIPRAIALQHPQDVLPWGDLEQIFNQIDQELSIVDFTQENSSVNIQPHFRGQPVEPIELPNGTLNPRVVNPINRCLFGKGN